GKGSNSEFFAPVIRASAQLVIPTISLYEVYERIVLQRDEEEALSAIGWMTIGLVADLTMEIALTAADLSVEHKLPMADSIILATARTHNATLWTQDEHFKGMPEVRYVEKK
ncbi:MAG TPA: type II toxin-antitoxin system VapC family toxin, partial [Anaerolineales bacterium]|nr:type II toxin-antitoxin system VapC family toxin [Anaerolineales bacterium]